jgi:hypothetical protein
MAKQASKNAELKLGGGRRLPHLFFITQPERLIEKFGKDNFQVIEKIITAAKMPIYYLPDGMHNARDCVLNSRHFLQKCHKEKAIKGVVLLGGDDVVPFEIRNTLDGSFGNANLSDFLVWSDDGYGVLGDLEFPDLPVSRIPDGNSFALMIAALTAKKISKNRNSMAIINTTREYGIDIYENFVPYSNKNNLWLYHDQTHKPNPPAKINGSFGYIILHGSTNAEIFSGSNRSNFTVDDVKKSQLNVVFSAACYSATQINSLPSEVSQRYQRVAIDNSIALEFLRQGTLAYIGVVVEHISSADDKFLLGKPFHIYFWKALKRYAPAKALWIAKQVYTICIPHYSNNPRLTALEYKLSQSFICLGLGW